MVPVAVHSEAGGGKKSTLDPSMTPSIQFVAVKLELVVIPLTVQVSVPAVTTPLKFVESVCVR
jgi:hypothetical protein